MSIFRAYKWILWILIGWFKLHGQGYVCDVLYGKHEMTFEVNLDAIKVYKKMHVAFVN